MRICVPTLDDSAESAQVCDHFGSAPYFTIYDFEGGTYETLNNSDREHEHGMCHPMSSVTEKGVDAVVCRGLGGRALQRLRDGGVRVLKTEAATVGQIVRIFPNGELNEISAEDACRNHSCH